MGEREGGAVESEDQFRVELLNVVLKKGVALFFFLSFLLLCFFSQFLFFIVLSFFYLVGFSIYSLIVGYVNISTNFFSFSTG
jgi:hypothetical protein